MYLNPPVFNCLIRESINCVASKSFLPKCFFSRKDFNRFSQHLLLLGLEMQLKFQISSLAELCWLMGWWSGTQRTESFWCTNLNCDTGLGRDCRERVEGGDQWPTSVHFSPFASTFSTPTNQIPRCRRKAAVSLSSHASFGLTKIVFPRSTSCHCTLLMCMQ